MANQIDKRNVLDDAVFTYRVTKENKVFIYWHGKQVKILKGTAVQKFIRKIEGQDHKETQLVMAKITGNFKRGNERS